MTKPRGPVRVCMIGAECTGKTTLSQRLGKHYGAPVLLERGRDYFARKAEHGDASVYTGDIIKVVDLQVRLEDSAPPNVPLVIMDTDIFTIAIWHARCTGKHMKELERLARVRQSTDARVDLYLLMSPDIPFVHDSIRSSAANRAEMHGVFKDTLVTSGRPFVEIFGSYEERFERAVAAVDRALEHGRGRPTDHSTTLP